MKHIDSLLRFKDDVASIKVARKWYTIYLYFTEFAIFPLSLFWFMATQSFASLVLLASVMIITVLMHFFDPLLAIAQKLEELKRK